MQTFYLSRNQHGYFMVRFSDPVSGKLSKAKSTHTKNRQQATLIADEWCRNGSLVGLVLDEVKTFKPAIELVATGESKCVSSVDVGSVGLKAVDKNVSC